MTMLKMPDRYLEGKLAQDAIDLLKIEISAGIAEALTPMGTPFGHETGLFHNTIRFAGLPEVGYEIDLVRRDRGWSYRVWLDPTDAFYVTVKDYPHTKVFRSKKTGFDYEAIAAHILEVAKAEQAKQVKHNQAELLINNNELLLLDMKEPYALGDAGCYLDATTTGFDLNCERSLTQEEARAWLKFAREMKWI